MAFSGELMTGEMYTWSSFLDRELFKRQESEQYDESD